jgi:hypothetical protein
MPPSDSLPCTRDPKYGHPCNTFDSMGICENCAPRIKEELAKFGTQDTQPAEIVDAFSVHLEKVNSKPGMVLTIQSTDGSFPLLADPDKIPEVAIQEMLLKFMGAVYGVLKDDAKFNEVCTKFGIKFNVE